MGRNKIYMSLFVNMKQSINSGCKGGGREENKQNSSCHEQGKQKTREGYHLPLNLIDKKPLKSKKTRKVAAFRAPNRA